MTLRVMAIEGGQCLRKGIDKEWVPMLSWEHKQLGDDSPPCPSETEVATLGSGTLKGQARTLPRALGTMLTHGAKPPVARRSHCLDGVERAAHLTGVCITMPSLV